MRVADVIFQIFQKLELKQIFLITGGFAMHLNDATFLNKHFNVTCMHHEQALSYAALGYAKNCGFPAIVEVTSGCAATNCITPLVDAWQDNVPIIFISGNTQSTGTIRYNRLFKNYNSRHITGADVDIIEMVKSVTKFSREVYDEKEIIKVVIRAFLASMSGRRGPSWISIPLDIQSKDLEFNNDIFDRAFFDVQSEYTLIQNPLDLNFDFTRFQRPLIIAGQGIRSSNTISKFKNFVETLKIPFVTTFLSVDVLPDDHPLYQGRIGVVGERCGNFTTANCDCLIVLGSRLASTLVGYNPQWFAREAFKIVVDIDSNEHSKTTLKIDQFVHCDLSYFFQNQNLLINTSQEWLQKCAHWKSRWFLDEPPLVEDDSQGVNPYFVMRQLSNYTPSDTVFTHSAGSLVTCTWHRLEMRGSRRFLNSASGGDMGQELPGSIGAYFATPDRKICCLVGDGSLQFNIQELQTIVHHQIPMVVVVMDNSGYSAIKITQTNYFKGNYIGVNSDSGVSFPNLEKIAKAYEILYYYVEKNEELNQELIESLFSLNKPCILHIKVCDQERHPKISAQKTETGFVSQPFENMYPFLSTEDFLEEMIVKPLK